MKKPITRKQALDKVISNMNGVMMRKEIVEAILNLAPSKAKDPASAIMNDFRFHPDIVPLGNGRYARTDYVLEGGKIRVKPTEREIAAGILNYFWFVPFDQVMPPGESVFVDKEGETIPVVTKVFDPASLSDDQIKSMLVNAAEEFLGMPLEETFSTTGIFDDDDFDDDEWEGFDDDLEDDEDEDEKMIEERLLNDAREMLKARGKEEFSAHDFAGFFQRNEVKEGDAIIVTLKPEENTYLFEHEPASQAQRLLIRHHDVEMNQLMHEAIKRSKRADARDIIFKAFGTFEWLKEYPSTHWMEIVERDDRLRLISLTPNHLEIASIEYQTMFDMLGMDQSTQKKQLKHARGLEEEIDDFCDRFDEAYEAAIRRLTDEADNGGAANVVEPVRGLYAREEFEDEYLSIDEGLGINGEPAASFNGRGRHGGLRVIESSEDEPDAEFDEEEESDYEKIGERNDELISRFFDSQSRKKGGDAATGKTASDVAMFADFLSNYHGCAIEYADCDMLEDFLFMWYPRKVLNSSPTHVRQIATSLRDFYRFLANVGVIRSAKFAEAMYELRDLAGEKVSLYDRLPRGEGFESLFERLFGWGW